ncbi:MAG: F0F1 ATP synthase subunit B [bacterium]
MEETLQHNAGTEVSATESHGASANVMDVQKPMVILTWVTFALLALVLYKVAWKPILTVLDLREKSIRDALAEAERARADAAATEARNRESLKVAEQEARRLVAEARTAAQETARLVENQAEQKAKAFLAEAVRDIEAATEQARLTLRHETTELAISLAGKVLAANMDTERNRALMKDLEKAIGRE